MQLIQLLQESSSLSVADLKKAMTKDSRTAPIFKKEVKLDQINDKEALLSTLKFYLFNNENVKDFVKSRNNIKDVDLTTFNSFRKMRGNDLTEKEFEWLKDFIAQLFKEHGAVVRGTFSPDLKKQLAGWFNSNGRYFNLPGWAMKELMSVPGIRPSKRIVLYRGVLFSEGSLKSRERYDGTLEEGDGLKFLKTIRKGGKDVDLTWDRPSSWTTSKEIADRFAKFGPASSHFGAMMQWFDRSSKKAFIDGALGFVVSTFADPEDILIDTKMLNGKVSMQHGDEGEVILKPGTYLSRIVHKYTVDGEVDPAAGNDTENEPAVGGLSKIKEFAESFAIPKELMDILADYENGARIWNGDSIRLLRNPEGFRKLILNSTTTSALHLTQKLFDFHNKELSELKDEHLRADKFAHSDELGKNVNLLKDFTTRMREKVSHSKFKSDKNPKAVGLRHQLSAEEYRTTIKSFDLDRLEKDLLTRGKIESDSNMAFSELARCLGVELPSSAKLSMFGAVKQKQYIDAALRAFFKLVKLSYDEENQTENVKTFINLVRKAYRNYEMIDKLKDTEDNLKEIK